MPTDLTSLGLPANLPEIAAPDLIGAAPAPPPALPPVALRKRQKAAIIVRLLLSDGRTLDLADLPMDIQLRLTRDIGAITKIDQSTLDAVITEFLDEIEQTGLAFGGGLSEALSILDGTISPDTARQLSREEGIELTSNPWKRLAEMDPERLCPIVEAEAPEVAAVLLSKLAVEKAAAILGMLDGSQARRIAFAVSRTESIGPDAVQKIGRSILAQLDAEPRRAFEVAPVDRVGQILNRSPSVTRESVLDGLEEDDKDFAARVRKAIFTFENIPGRIATTDIPKITRGVDGATLAQAIKASQARQGQAGDYILENLSRRMSDQLKEDIAGLGDLKAKDAEAAMDAVVQAIRQLMDQGEIYQMEAEED
ncbi:MAG: FliG C-terminal domain-containing protein [Pseudomonadota bacterium]